MIESLHIEDLGVIEEADLVLSPGLTALTGETGAGKTMVLTSLGLLLGQRAESTIVSSLGPLSPVCAFVLGWVFLNEQLGGRALAGFVLVLLSIIGVQRAMMPRTGTTSTSLSRHDS